MATSVQAPPTAARHNLETRPLPVSVKKYLIIGLDGATFDVLDPLMDTGHMPNFKRFCENGVRGVLMSTRPPITPAAWTTFMTGKGPGRHGILDFEKYEPRAHSLTFNSTYEIREKRCGSCSAKRGCASAASTYR